MSDLQWFSPPAWVDSAACGQIGPALADDLFFVPKGGNGTVGRRICQHCPVIDECLEYALENEPDGRRFGIWGGTSPGDRHRMVRERRAS